MIRAEHCVTQGVIFSRKLWVIALLDCILGLLLFIISLLLLSSYLRYSNLISAGPTVLWVIFSICFMAEPVVAFIILLGLYQASTSQRIETFSNWLSISTKSTILVVPEFIFFFVFYTISPVLAAVGVILCLLKLVLHFYKLNTVSAFMRRGYETLGIFEDIPDSIASCSPSYGASPTFEDILKQHRDPVKV